MNLLYIGYWNLDDPLTVSTIFPGLKLLRKQWTDSKLVFVNIQREPLPIKLPEIFEEFEILYHPLLSGNKLRNKLQDFWNGPVMIRKLCKAYNVTTVIARGTPAGALAYLVWKKNKIPFLVESFEPHADYMVESGVWSKFDLRYVLQRHWENMQKKYAVGLMPVATNYQNQLIREDVEPERIQVVPCGVNKELFLFNEHERWKCRKELGIGENTIVGIYVGKFGGLYLADESFMLYKIFFDQLPDFSLVILTSERYHAWISDRIGENRLPADKIIVRSVKHSEVGKYCSASDFAFATYKPGRSKAYLSPVKVGEYWASGLPIILTAGVGDESSLIENGFGGVLFEAERINPDSLVKNITKLMDVVRLPSNRATISKAGIELRSFEKQKMAYNYFLSKR